MNLLQLPPHLSGYARSTSAFEHIAVKVCAERHQTILQNKPSDRHQRRSPKTETRAYSGRARVSKKDIDWYSFCVSLLHGELTISWEKEARPLSPLATLPRLPLPKTNVTEEDDGNNTTEKQVSECFDRGRRLILRRCFITQRS